MADDVGVGSTPPGPSRPQEAMKAGGAESRANAEITPSIGSLMGPVTPNGAPCSATTPLKVAGSMGARQARTVPEAGTPRRPVIPPPSAATSAGDVRLGSPEGAIGLSGAVATVALMRQGIRRGATAEVYVGRMATGPAASPVPNLTPGALAHGRAAQPPALRLQTAPARPARDALRADARVDAPTGLLAPPIRPVISKAGRVATARVPTAEAPDNRPVATGDARVVLAPLRPPPKMKGEILEPMPAVLGVPNKERPTIPERIAAGEIETGAVAVAAATPSGTVTVRATPELLGVSDGTAPIAHGEISGGRHPLAATPVLKPQEEVLTGAPLFEPCA